MCVGLGPLDCTPSQVVVCTPRILPDSTAGAGFGRAALRAQQCTASGGGVACSSPGRVYRFTAGRDVLRRGGNAVDAAIAAVFCVGAVQPEASGIGGGAFLLIWNAHRSTPWGVWVCLGIVICASRACSSSLPPVALLPWNCTVCSSCPNELYSRMWDVALGARDVRPEGGYVWGSPPPPPTPMGGQQSGAHGGNTPPPPQSEDT